MSNNTSSIVSKVWSFCNPLRDVGVGYDDYHEQLTYITLLSIRIIDLKDKDLSVHYFNKGLKLGEKNKYEMAVTEFSKAIKHDSTAYGAYFNRAYCNYQMRTGLDLIIYS